MTIIIAALGLPASDAATAFEAEAFLALAMGLVVGVLSVLAAALNWGKGKGS